LTSIIISPSGKLYGSEQVLLDYLRYSKGKFLIFTCGKDLLYSKLKRDFSQHQIFTFKKVKILYLRILYLCLTRRIHSIYLNEAGHTKFIILLSKIFNRVKFVVHVRLVEDAQPQRWPYKFNRNLKVLSVSNFIQKILSVENTLIYDPYFFSVDGGGQRQKMLRTGLQIAVIGRVSATKGIGRIIQLLEVVKEMGYQEVFYFKLYGDIMPDVVENGMYESLKRYPNIAICGYEPVKEKIYNSVDCVLHASDVEPLGRIFLEAIDYHKPFIGIKGGGVGEIGDLLHLHSLLIHADELSTSGQFLRKLLFVRDNYELMVQEIAGKKKLAMDIFSPGHYAQKIDSLLLN
jgi:hypothetical protein